MENGVMRKKLVWKNISAEKKTIFMQIIVHSDDSASKFGELYVDYSLVSDKGFEKIRRSV